MQGVPDSICDLIFNMIDCINGSLMRNESYSEMFDVMSDLRLMLEMPWRYLHPLDMDRVLQTGLELDETVFARDQEFASLQCAYQRSMSGSSELAIITGVSGTGKTTIANRLGDLVTSNGGLFLSGKFDQMMTNSSLTVASAFSRYCDLLANEKDSEQARHIAFKLRAALGEDVHHLTQMFPSLSSIMNDGSSGESLVNQDCVDARQRHHYQLCQFVEVICTSSQGLVLFLDDFHWADSESISIITHLLKTSRSRRDGKIFFLGSCRDDEIRSDHPFWEMINSLRNLGVNTTQVKLDCMDMDTVNRVVSHLLHLPPRLVKSLSDTVFQKTMGNPLFVTRMLRSWNSDGLLRVSLTKHKWEWDEDRIQSTKIPDDVASFFVHSISSLPVEVKIALGTLSCFGNSVSCEIINAIQADLKMNLVEPLNKAIAEGFVDKVNEKYCFSHDRIQEAAYSMIDKHDVCLHHLNFGVR
jgi:predicted ATPase